MADAVFRGSRAELRELLGKLVAALAGESNEYDALARGILLRIGVAMLSQVRQDFVVKSRGGTGRDGIKWPPLKPETIAQRRTTAGERRTLGIGGKRERGLLTPEQNKRWKAMFRQQYARFAVELGHGPAKARAAAFAWTVLKAEGAQTKLAVLGSRVVDILRDTGLLLQSLSPVVNGPPPDGQVLEPGEGTVTVGSTVHPWHHRGVPGKLPARPFWPLDGTVPEAWWEGVRAAGRDALKEAVGEILRGKA